MAMTDDAGRRGGHRRAARRPQGAGFRAGGCDPRRLLARGILLEDSPRHHLAAGGERRRLMTGRDRGADIGPIGNSPVVILVRPQLADNVGAVARAMANGGLFHLRLVAPRDGWPQEKAWRMASGADRILDAVDAA